jgi:hypothetical protein
MHGGTPGSGAPRGNKNALKHGRYTREAIEEPQPQLQHWCGNSASWFKTSNNRPYHWYWLVATILPRFRPSRQLGTCLSRRARRAPSFMREMGSFRNLDVVADTISSAVKCVS